MKQFFTLILAVMMSSSVYSQNLSEINYQDGSQKLKGLVTPNKGEKLPGILILPAWMGIDKEAKSAAIDLEKQGYIALIADIYGVGNTPKDMKEASKIAGEFKNNYKLYQQRINKALEALVKQGADPKKLAIIGYCFGGTGALEAARADFPVQGVVSIHGGLSKDHIRPNSIISTKILIEHPANDQSVSKEDYEQIVKELNDGRADWQIITYANSGHTFTNPESKEYNPVMAKRAWNHTLMFLKEILK